jgi:hypothetical protein
MIGLRKLRNVTQRHTFAPSISSARQLVRVATSAGKETGRRNVDRALHRGWHERPLDFERDRVALLFFEDVESGDWRRHFRRGARRVLHAARGAQRMSGFEVAFGSLVESVRREGWVPIVNDYALARANPDYPVIAGGYPHILDNWTLPNPVVLGPGLFDHPSQRPNLFDDPRFRSYIVPCEWVRELFAPRYGDRCVLWYAGIDADHWRDASTHEKDIDFLVYDKIRWARERYVPEILEPVLAELAKTGLRVEVVRYGKYERENYRNQLERAKSMVFICEHETQGLAYQEAMAMNVPILAWDNGFWLDPQRFQYSDVPVPGSSVPFFGPECGERFVDAVAFPGVLETFRGRLDRSEFNPRNYVERVLSFEESGNLFLKMYTSAFLASRAK